MAGLVGNLAELIGARPDALILLLTLLSGEYNLVSLITVFSVADMNRIVEKTSACVL